MLLARSSAFLLWALTAGVAVAWGLRLTAQGPTVPADVAVVGSDAPRVVDWARLFGADAAPPTTEEAPPPPEASRFQLVGLVAGGAGAPGVALLSVDGAPARAFRVGAAVDGQWVVLRIDRAEVALGPAGAAPVVRLPAAAMPPPAVGTLPAVPPLSAAGGAPGLPAFPPPSVGMPAAGAVAPGGPALPDAFRRAAAGLPTAPAAFPPPVLTEGSPPERIDRRPPELTR
jgi:general secretion pathway protein C